MRQLTLLTTTQVVTLSNGKTYCEREKTRQSKQARASAAVFAQNTHTLQDPMYVQTNGRHAPCSMLGSERVVSSFGECPRLLRCTNKGPHVMRWGNLKAFGCPRRSPSGFRRLPVDVRTRVRSGARVLPLRVSRVTPSGAARTARVEGGSGPGGRGGEHGRTRVAPGLRKIRKGSGGRVLSGSAVSDSPSARQIDRVR